MPAAVSQSSRVSFTQSEQEQFVLPSFADQVHNGPALLATLQALQGKFHKLAATQPATERDGQNRSIPFSSKRMAIGNCQSANASPAVSPLPKREPSLRTPMMRSIPATSSGLNRPASAAS